MKVDWKFLGDDKNLKEFITTKHKHSFSIDYYQQGLANFSDYVKESGVRVNSRTLMTISRDYVKDFQFLYVGNRKRQIL